MTQSSIEQIIRGYDNNQIAKEHHRDVKQVRPTLEKPDRVYDSCKCRGTDEDQACKFHQGTEG